MLEVDWLGIEAHGDGAGGDEDIGSHERPVFGEGQPEVGIGAVKASMRMSSFRRRRNLDPGANVPRPRQPSPRPNYQCS